MLDEARAADEALEAEHRTAAMVHVMVPMAKALGVEFEDEPGLPARPHFVADLYEAHGLGPTVAGSVPVAAPGRPEATPVAPDSTPVAPDAVRARLEASGMAVEDAEPGTFEDGPADTDVTALAAWVTYANQVVSS